MKQWLNIPIIVCVFLIACSVRAEDRPTLPKSQSESDLDDYYKKRHQAFCEIKIFDKRTTKVLLADDAEKTGLDENELTDYLRLRVKSNFTDIKFVKDITDSLGKYKSNQVGSIVLFITMTGENYPIACNIAYVFYNFNIRIWEADVLGVTSKEKASDSIKKSIDDVIPEIAINFYKARGEL